MPSPRPTLRRLGRFVWLASTPLALTLLCAEPRARAQGWEELGGDHGADTAGHLVDNPILNFWSWSYRGQTVHGHKMPAPFSMALVNFMVLVFLVGKFAAPSLGRMVRDRHEAVAKALAESARLRDEARAKLDEYARRLDRLDEEVAALVADVRAEAQSEKARIIADAEARAARIQREAEQQVQAEAQRVRAELEREALEAAIHMARDLLKARMTDSDQRALANRFVTALGQATSATFEGPGRTG